MKKLIVASAFILASTSAYAADAVYEVPAAPEAVIDTPVFTWSGGYVGLQGGGSFVNGDFNTGTASDSENFNGGIFGAFAGWNYQLENNIVLGVEGDVNYNWNENDYLGADVGTDWSGSARARLGYAMDTWLVYGTGGWAATRGYVDVDGADEETETFKGWTVGAGVEKAFTSNVFGRAEYRFTDYGDENIAGANVDLDQHTIMVGVGVKF